MKSHCQVNNVIRVVSFLFLISLLFGCRIAKQTETSEELVNIGEIPKTLYSEGNDKLTKLLINIRPVDYCDDEHHHFVDIIAKHKIDSLIKLKIDTILYYRDWIGTNGFNGYGKLQWKKNNKIIQHQLNFENYAKRYGISSILRSVQVEDEALAFFFNNRVDTVKTDPREPKFWMSHAADHFVYVYARKNEYCFNVSGLNLNEDPSHLKSKMINLLRIPTYYYFDMLKEWRNTKN